VEDFSMTTDHQMATMYAAQQQVIVALHSIGDLDLADRLERCMAARRERRGGDGWPFTCRSAACAWCRRPMIRSWWNGMCQWSAEAATASLAIISLHSSAGLPDAVLRLRRGLRDVRDQMARHRRSWRDLSFAGMAGGDGTALVMITHNGVDQREVQDVLCARWPEVVVKTLEQEQPVVAMLPGEAADLGRCRRGVEPLRIVVMPQHDRQGDLKTSGLAFDPVPVEIDLSHQLHGAFATARGAVAGDGTCVAVCPTCCPTIARPAARPEISHSLGLPDLPDLFWNRETSSSSSEGRR
jgi:hypothetical protein